MRRFVLSVFLFTGPVFADDPTLANWPNWRGPLNTGIAPQADPPIRWDANTNIRWKVPLEGRGSATPIVWDDLVFLVTAIPTDRPGEPPAVNPRFEKRTQPTPMVHQFVVLCLDRNTGKTIWRQVAAERVPHEGHHQTHSYAAGSPTTDGKHLYVSFGSFGVYCYTLDGQLKWQRDLGLINSRLGWGEAVTPVVHGNSLLLNWDTEGESSLICLDAGTGATKWKTKHDEKTSWNTPLVVNHNGRDQVVVNGTKAIRCYDLATGEELWTCGGMTLNAIPSAVANGDVVYLMSGYQGMAARAIRLGGHGDITDTPFVLWRHDRGTPYVPSPLLLNDRLWFTQANNNLLTVLDTATGKPILDRERMPGVTNFYSSPSSAAGRVYFVDRAGTTLVLKAAEKLDVLGINKLDDGVDASPVLVGKQLLLRGEKFLWCIEETK
jgi:outer membrane protein assembly factor BamB